MALRVTVGALLIVVGRSRDDALGGSTSIAHNIDM